LKKNCELGTQGKEEFELGTQEITKKKEKLLEYITFLIS
jgi:hypothetical protein